MTHKIKLHEGFADDVLSGKKPFEVRENDRGYQCGDTVVFEVVCDSIYRQAEVSKHPLNGKTYEITYVLSGWGLENGFVAFGIRPKEA